ncbi:MAG: phosphoribosylamine--glycine ligase [Eubacterium sp.]|jgi:phosphoribosylamine--glycine ligase|nr:phosphoribosylamine--glycine ligase [Eubacterium sp.]
MKVLVVGGGGREHAVCKALKKSARVSEIHAAPGNAGISKIAEVHDVKATDIVNIISLAKEISADYVFVTPDDPLVMGMVDALESEGFKTFGPRKNAAVIEGSKVFSKAFMKRHNIPTAEYKEFGEAEKAIDYIKSQNSFPTVIKYDGLALGKGVTVAKDFIEAEDAINFMLTGKKFGDKGIIIEECLEGPEITVLAFTDGITVRPMIASTDHKRALDNDEGPNTGGMGVIAPSPFYTHETAQIVESKIIRPTIDGLLSEGRRFKGCIYFGLMLTSDGPKVIEYNCRFGDPEAQVILPLLETDLLDIIEAVHDEKLDSLEVRFKDMSAACVILASEGYPNSYETGVVINGLNDGGDIDSIPDVSIYHSGTKFKDGRFFTAGGRVLGAAALDKTLSEAVKRAYNAVEKVSFNGMHYRKDIGKKAVSIINAK